MSFGKAVIQQLSKKFDYVLPGSTNALIS